MVLSIEYQASSAERAQPNGGDRPEDDGGVTPTADRLRVNGGQTRKVETEKEAATSKAAASCRVECISLFEPGPSPKDRPVLTLVYKTIGKCDVMRQSGRSPTAGITSHLAIVGGLDHARSLSRSEA